MKYKNFIITLIYLTILSGCATSDVQKIELSNNVEETELCKTYLSEYDNLFSSDISNYSPSRKEFLIDLVYQINILGLDKDTCLFLVSNSA